MQLAIDFAQTKDIEAIHLFQLAHAKEVEGLILDSMRVRQGIEQVLERPHLGFYLVAREVGVTMCHEQAAAIGTLLVTKEWSDWRAKMVWWIQSVYVQPAHRAQGVFSALFRYVENLALQQDVAGLRLYVEKNNHVAKKVYAKLGMVDDHYDLFEKMFHPK